MKRSTIPVAYIPLVDSAPVILAQEMGFAEAEGIQLDLIAAPSWSSLRDMLAFGQVDAAHMLSTLPIATQLGLGGLKIALSAVSILSVNGDVVGVSREIEERMRAQGHDFDFQDARHAARALSTAHEGKLVVGVPFPFSMHVDLLKYWSEKTELGANRIDIRTVPPQLMADALADGDIHAFCVGEPWGSVAVDRGIAALLLPGCAIWQGAPEKVLATRTNWAEQEPDTVGRLIRAVWQASRWLETADHRTVAAEILGRPQHLNLPPELIDRALSGRMILSGRGEHRQVDDFLRLSGSTASFPWRSQAKWIAHRLCLNHQISGDLNAAAEVFRSDLYRKHMAVTEADLPGASEKLEGAIQHPLAVASVRGQLMLPPDRFFDGQIFDPHAPI